MDWQMIMRRCPSRSMTIVGDVAQTSAEGGAASWQQALEPYVADRWRLAELTVNYRTPAEIMDVAAEVLARLDAGLRPPISVRETGAPPWREHLATDTMVDRLRELADAERATVAEGTVAVLCPASLATEIRAGVQLDRVSVLTVERAKGLEFDSVIVVEPDQIVASSSRGLSDLYVALTRATQRLGIVYRGSGPRNGVLTPSPAGKAV